MSYQEKRTTVSLVWSICFIAAYCIYTFGKINSGVINPNNLQSLSKIMLVFIGIGIITMIIIQIIFHILLSIGTAIKNREEGEEKIESAINAELVEDEMDKLIEMKANRIGNCFTGVGFIVSLASLALGVLPSTMLNIMFISFAISALVSSGFALYYYRVGIK